MAYCTSCGQALLEGAKFCTNCGAAVSTETWDDSFSPISHAEELHKCPNCGELLPPFSVECPVCKYELRGTQVSSSIQQFAYSLAQASDAEQYASLVRDFPIPNDKEDIFEYMFLASTNIAEASDPIVFEAWAIKFEQCYQNTKLRFSADQDFKKIQSIYKRTSKIIAKGKVIQSAKSARDSAGSMVQKYLAIMPSPFFAVAVIFLVVRVVIRLFKGVFIPADITLSAIILVIIYSITSKKSNKQGQKEDDDDDENSEMVEDDDLVTVPLSAFSFSEKNYGVVASLFKHAGFTNIETVPLHDLRKGMIFRRAEERTSDLVKSIHINGKPLTFFKRTFPADSSVIISYHSFQN